MEGNLNGRQPLHTFEIVFEIVCIKVSYQSIRNAAYNVVNHALDSRLQRESAWTSKSSTTVSTQSIIRELQGQKGH